MRLQTKLDLDTASPVVVSFDALSEYIKKDCGAGFLFLQPITQEVILILALVSLGGISIAQMGPMHNMMGHSMVRHHYAMMNGIPKEYRNLSNPIKATKENIKAGEKLYNSYCVSCHGTKGYGDGPSGQALNPPPANIASAVCMPMATDSYLFWTISDGGKNLGTTMPSFKETFPKDDIWKVILYVRGGLSNC